MPDLLNHIKGIQGGDNAASDDARRLQFLNTSGFQKKANVKYTKFVRMMRLVLPLMALIMIWLVVYWPRIQNTMEPVAKEDLVPVTVGKNELLRPRFQSTDKKDQPFNVTAHRALQSSYDPSVVILERPMADITLNNGDWLAAEATRGAYRQKVEKLFLEGDVRLYHDRGYQLQTEKMVINLAKNQAWSDTRIYGQGPAGVLEATGMQAYSERGQVIFTGPVSLKLNRSLRGL